MSRPGLFRTEIGVSFALASGSRKAAAASTALMAAASNSNTSNDNIHPFLQRFMLPVMIPPPPRARAVIYMAMAMAFHFGGYEFARSANLALFTSADNGFASPGAFPLAIALVSPLSVLLLSAYTQELEQHGPKVALRYTTILSLVVMVGSGILLKVLDHVPNFLPNFPMNNHGMARGGLSLSKLVVGLAFIFQNSYAHLLYSQQWSFLGSVMTPLEGSTWFASIAGLSSLAATFSGSFVSVLANRFGLIGLLVCTALTLVGSLVCAERAYATSEQHGFDPAQERLAAKKEHDASRSSSTPQTNAVRKAMSLFTRVPILGALFCEVLTFQSLSTILNVCFVTQLKATIVDDVARAAWTGKFYALVNAASAAFQFIILPLCMKQIEPSWAWRLMPIIPVACSFVQNLQVDPSLYILAFSYFAAKLMDYSLRGVVNEMVYVPLDFESRYVGKEIIGVFANRFGKSGMSLLLSVLTYSFGNFGVRELTALSTAASVSWMGCSLWLSGLVPKQAQAQKVVDERRLKRQ